MFVYLTSKRYPATTADHRYIEELARAGAQLTQEFLLVVAGGADDLAGIPTYELPAMPLPRRLLYMLWFPWFVVTRRLRGSEAVFFANDLPLLRIAAWWRPVLRASYRICSDWHLLTTPAIDRLVVRSSDRLITTSMRLRTRLIERTAVDPDRVTVVYGGVDPSAFQGAQTSREALGLPEQGFVVGYVGLFSSLGHEKGLRDMVRALHFLPQDTHVALIGGTPLEINRYRELGQQIGVEDRLHLIERQPRERVAHYERALDALVIPYPDQEHFREYGFPMKVYEYLCAQRPIIYSKLEILDEILETRGISFDPGNPKDLARAIASVRELGEQAPRGFPDDGQRFSWVRKAEAILVATGSLNQREEVGTNCR